MNARTENPLKPTPIALASPATPAYFCDIATNSRLIGLDVTHSCDTPSDTCAGPHAKRSACRGIQLSMGLVLMALTANAAARNCEGNAGSFIVLGTLNIDTTLPVGSVLADITTTTVNAGGSARCTGGTYTSWRRGSTSIVRGRDVYRSNIPGIGYRIGAPSGNDWYPRSLTTAWGSGVIWAVPVRFRIQLVKTGEIAAGGVLSGEAAHAHVAGYVPWERWYWRNATIVPTFPTCAFTVNNGRDVDLGRHDAGMFTGVGSTSPAMPFNITSGGCNAETTRVHMSWKGTVDADDNQTFRITTGTLRGASVWIEKVSDGATMVPNGERQSFEPPAIGEAYEYRARLKQTLPTITEGTGNAAVSINITYN